MNDKTKLLIMHGIGFAFVCFYGAVVHDLAKIMTNFLGRMLFSTNLSLWEQGKILLTGMSIWFIIEYIVVGRRIKGFVFISTVVAAALPALMLIIYMSHSQIFGDLSLEGAHIMLSVGLILAGFLTSSVMVISKRDYSIYTPYGIAIYIVVVLVYAVFTFLPPNTGMFYDAVNNAFGPVW